MNIRALTIAAFVSVLILGGALVPFSQSGTSCPAPAPFLSRPGLHRVSLVTWTSLTPITRL